LLFYLKYYILLQNVDTWGHMFDSEGMATYPADSDECPLSFCRGLCVRIPRTDRCGFFTRPDPDGCM